MIGDIIYPFYMMFMYFVCYMYMYISHLNNILFKSHEVSEINKKDCKVEMDDNLWYEHSLSYITGCYDVGFKDG